VAGLAACAHGTPRIEGGPGAPPSPSTFWPVPEAVRTPPPGQARPQAPEATAALAAGAATAGAVRELALEEAVGLALRNHPSTRESYALARAAADRYGASRGQYFPTVDAGVNLSRSGSRSSGGATGSGGTGGTGTGGTGTGSGGTGTGTGGTGTGGTGTGTGGTGTGGSGGTTSITRTQLSPSVTLSYLIFDLGGRSGSVEAARQRAIAANLDHNATVRAVILQVESNFFSYLATRALREAQRVAVSEAEADLAAAEERHRVGLAAIDEVLQTRTALAQARLQLATSGADLQVARGNLAYSMGLPANAAFDIPTVAADDGVAGVAASVDSMINRAIAARPELAAARADAASLAAQVRVARSAGLPALAVRSSASYTRAFQPTTGSSRNYSVDLGVDIPVFDGGTRQYNLRAARDELEAGLARVLLTERQIAAQVFGSYYSLQAATQRVRISGELLGYAQQSATVAAGRYRGGVGLLVDVLLARTTLATARAEAIRSRWEWRTALVQLGHDVGSLDLAGRPNVLLGTDTTDIP
jgi:outer membrane protein TolC